MMWQFVISIYWSRLTIFRHREHDGWKYLASAKYGPTFLRVHRHLLKQTLFMNSDAILLHCSFWYVPEFRIGLFHLHSSQNEWLHSHTLQWKEGFWKNTQPNGSPLLMELPNFCLSRSPKKLLTRSLTQSIKSSHSSRTRKRQKLRPKLTIPSTLSSKAATVMRLFPYIFFICVTPFPTTLKFSEDPRARMLAEWGDHLIVEFGSFYLATMEIPGRSICV